MKELDHAKRLNDDELISKLSRCVREDRELTARLLVHLGEVDARKLYRDQGFNSMFDYCVRALYMSESEADLRIKAARIARQFPHALEMLARGQLHMTALRLLAPVLTASNAYLLNEACFKSKLEVKELLAKHFPAPDVPESMRRLPQPRAMPTAQQPQLPVPALNSAHLQQQAVGLLREASLLAAPLQSHSLQPSAAPPFASDPPRLEFQPSGAPLLSSVRARSAQNKPAVTAPLSEGRYRVEFTASQSLHAMFKEARDLCCDDVPNGELATIVEQALILLIAQKKTQRFALTSQPRKQWLPSAGGRASSKRRDDQVASKGAADGTLNRAREAGRLSGKRDEGKPAVRPREVQQPFANRDTGNPAERQCEVDRPFAKPDAGELVERPRDAEQPFATRDAGNPTVRSFEVEQPFAARDAGNPTVRSLEVEQPFATRDAGELADRPRQVERPFAKRDEGKPGGRYVPSALRRAVYARDGGQCTFASKTGTRCCSRRDLEFHHIVPFARRGAMTLDNLSLMCRVHNETRCWRSETTVATT